MGKRLKKTLYIGTRLSQVLGRPAECGKRRVVFYPAFETKEDLADQVNRMRWYAPEGSAELWLPVEPELTGIDPYALPVPEHQRSPESKGAAIRLFEAAELEQRLVDADIICIWDASVPGWARKFLFRLPSVRILDPGFYRFAESHTSAAILWYDLLDSNARASFVDDSLRTLRSLYKEHGGASRAYVFGTGPSIKEACKHGFEDGIGVVCNSIVRNDELLERIRPKVLTFADCVFHFGASRYSEAFADDVVKVVRKYNSYCITTQVGYALMRVHYPELKDRLIGVPAKRFGPPRLLSPDSFNTRSYDNILTRFMLPTAASLAEEVVMMGFDGRKPDENYFWKHSPATQYTGTMESVYKTHEAFFRDIDYGDYYRKHCSDLAGMLDEFENNGKRFQVWGNTYIPALKDRQVRT